MVIKRKNIEPETFPFYDYKRYSLALAVRKGDCLFVSGHTSSQYDRSLERMICKGASISEQASIAYEKIGLIVTSAGGSLADVVKITEYVDPSGFNDYASVDKVKRAYFGSPLPAASVFIVNGLLRSDAFLEVEAVAVLGKSSKQEINLGGPTHQAIKKGKFLFASGQFGVDYHTGKIEGDIATQTAQSFRNISAVLAQVGATPNDIVKVIYYITPEGVPNYEASRRVQAQYFHDSYPAATELVVERLLREEALIEVDCIAIMGSDKKETFDVAANIFQGRICSPVVRKGKLTFLSGLAGIDLETNQLVAKGDVVGQLNQVFRNAERMLNAAGVGWKDVVKTVDSIAPGGYENYRQTAGIRRNYFRETLPASTGVRMNRLLWPGALIQVDFVAVAD